MPSTTTPPTFILQLFLDSLFFYITSSLFLGSFLLTFSNRLIYEIRPSVLIEMFVITISFRGTFKSFWDLTGKSAILVKSAL